MDAAMRFQADPDASRLVHEMTTAMEACAAAGEWERATEIAAGLRQAVMRVPGAQRREALLAAQRCLRQVHGLAHAAKGEVSDQLSALRRGRDATRAYTHTD